MTYFSQARPTCGTTHFIRPCTILHGTKLYTDDHCVIKRWVSLSFLCFVIIVSWFSVFNPATLYARVQFYMPQASDYCLISKIDWTQKIPSHMELEIKDLAWDRHTNCGRVKLINGILTLPFLSFLCFVIIVSWFSVFNPATLLCLSQVRSCLCCLYMVATQLLCSEETGLWYTQVKLTKISYFTTLFKYRFIQVSSLFKVWLRQVSLYLYCLKIKFFTCSPFCFLKIVPADIVVSLIYMQKWPLAGTIKSIHTTVVKDQGK
jgi:hypothetical protein